MVTKLKWVVIHGQKLGREIGFKTANIEVKEDEISEWTYKLNGIIGNDIFHWVGSYLPKKWVFEAHFFDFEKDIYNEEIEIFVLKKIRENKKFSSLEELKKQIREDVISAKQRQISVLTFGTFDVVHKWHEYYLREAKKLGDKLITVVAQDKNVLKFKWKLPLYDENTRKKQVEDMWIADVVIIGYGENPLKWIDEYNPQVICLWYDQSSFSTLLEEYKEKNNLNIDIIRLLPFQEHIYKSSLLKKEK